MLKKSRIIVFGLLLAIPKPSLAVPPPAKDLPQSGGGISSHEFDLPAWEAQRYQALSNWPPAETTPPVDITNYDLDLTFSLADTTVTGTATITLTWKNAATNILHLDLVGLTATSVRKATGPN